MTEPEARTAEVSASPEIERCDLCDTELDDRHGHVADLENRSILCTCRACYLLFTREAAGGLRYRAVPDRYLHDPGRPITAAEWEQLQIPVAAAFFLRSTSADSVDGTLGAFYPGPAGATECLLDLDAWARLEAEHPLLAEARSDVEAIVIRRDAGHEDCYLVPIDACYELVGRIRLHWRGFDGGSEAHASIDAFFDGLRARSRPLAQHAGADGTNHG
jgi:hypothetical protein